MINKLKGTGVAIVTPLQQNGSIDFDSFQSIINHCINGGVEYLVALGTTGETVTLNKEEKKQLIEKAAEFIDERVPLVVGFGGNNTAQIINDIETFDLTHVDVILSSGPAYNKPTQAGLYAHYKAIANSTEKPILLYNVPGRTSKNIEAQTTLKLAEDFENIIGIKEASGDFAQCMDIIKNKPDNFLVLSGDDLYTLPMLSFGFDGVISVVANAYPREFSDMVRLGLQGNFNRAKELHFLLMDFINLLFAENNPGGIKAALQNMNICEEHMRLPLVPVSNENRTNIIAEIEKIKSTVQSFV